MNFLKDKSNKHSFMRMIPFIMLMTFTFVWAAICIHKMEIVDFPPILAGVVMTLLTAKVSEKYIESKGVKQ